EAIAPLTNPVEHPALRFLQRTPAYRANPKGLQELECVVESQKEIPPGPERFTAGQAQIGLLGTKWIQFVQLLFARQNSSRFEMINNRQRYEHGAAPRRHFVNVKWRPPWEEHHFHRDCGKIFPGELAQQCKVKLAKRVHLRNAAATNDIRARFLHKRRVHRTAGELQCKICFRRCINFAWATMINAPSSVRQLAFENVTHTAPLQWRVHLAAPMHEKDIIRAEGAIDDQLSAPMAIWLLLAQQVLLRARDGVRNLFVVRRIRLRYLWSRARQHNEVPRKFRHVDPILTRLALQLPRVSQSGDRYQSSRHWRRELPCPRLRASASSRN